MRMSKLKYKHNLCLHCSERAFTLVELLFVVILLSILGLSVMKIITQVQASKITAEEKRTLAETANRIFLEMRTIFSSRGAGNLTANSATQQRDIYRSGPSHISYDDIPNSETKVLRISTLGSKYATPYLPSLYGEVEARFYVEKTSENNNFYNLVFEIWSSQSQPQQGISQSQQISNQSNSSPIIKKVLSTSVKNIKFRFRQQQQWEDQINTNFGSSPNLIEVTLELANPNNPNELEVFRTALPFGPPLR